jgi:hypothetical protein
MNCENAGFQTLFDDRWPSVLVEHCNYCGSITVARAIEGLKTPGTRFSGTDHKYGWPHKFQIDIPNPNPEALVPCGLTSTDSRGQSVNKDTPGAYFTPFDRKLTPEVALSVGASGYWFLPVMGRFPRVYGKFYNAHLKQVTPEQFAEFDALSRRIFGVAWMMEGNKLAYRVPKVGGSGWQLSGEIGPDGEPIFSDWCAEGGASEQLKQLMAEAFTIPKEQVN